MIKKRKVFQFIDCFNYPIATLFLFLLLCVDLTFYALHFIDAFTPYLNSPLNSLECDRGYPELFQYFKWLLIIILIGYVSKKRQSLSYAYWGFVFTYFLLDDSLKIHEKVGAYFANHFEFIPPLGLRVEDYGELTITATIGVLLFFLVREAYIREKQAFKKVSQDMLLLILILAFFGVGVDMLHVAIKLGWKVTFLLGVIEDGGEMFATSLILWYVFLLSARKENVSSYICDYISKDWGHLLKGLKIGVDL